MNRRSAHAAGGDKDADPVRPLAAPRHGEAEDPRAESLLEHAKTEYSQAGRRLSALGSRLSTGPSWNMLLDLFICGHACRRLSVTALCIGARTSSATALRYLAMLQDAGLVERTLDQTDARRSYVQLTNSGWRTMRKLLEP